MLRKNEDGEWTMPRGISVHDMAKEIEDAVRDFTLTDDYVKVTEDDYARWTKRGRLRCQHCQNRTSTHT